MKQAFLHWLSLFLVPVTLYSQQFDGNYSGQISGDLNGSFIFTIDHKYYNNLEGTFISKGGPTKIIAGMVKPDGTIDAYLYDRQSDITSALWKGKFTGRISNGQASGNYEVYDASATKPTTSKGTWNKTATAVKPQGPPLSCSYITGKDLPFNEDKPIALRFHLKLNDSWQKDYSIQFITIGARNPLPGRFAPDVDATDGFYVYTTESGLEITPAAGAKEADFNFEYAHFGSKEKLLLPKTVNAIFYVTLLNQQTGETRKEKLEATATITALCAILVNKCNLGDCPSLNGKTITKGTAVNAVSGDQLRIPLLAELWVKFLDGTVGYFTNKSQTHWILTLRGGHFSSTQQWEYTENAITIQTVAGKAIEKAGDELSDKAMEAGLQLLLQKSSAASPGLIVQLMEFMGASKAGGDLVAVKLRSRVELSIYPNGTCRIRNFEGSPEIWQKNSKPLLLPVGQQVFIDKKGIAGQPVLITGKPVAPEKTVSTQWAGTWQTKWGKMTITQNGNSITGTYEHDKGKISGTINGNKLSGNWSEAASYQPPSDAGEFEFTLSADGKTFTGRWRYGNNGAWQTGWDGHR